jgi:glycosyltransferase involved in cell wall biosynthesis
MVDVSLIICSHNPRPSYLRRVLDALRNQTLPQDRWELLLIDNASAVPIAPNWDLGWHAHARHVLECELGLSAARIRGIAEARGEVLVFVDDDNILQPNYLAEALRIKEEWPQLGVWGAGAVTPEFEIEPAAYVERLKGYLALRESTKARWSNVMSCDEASPLGAGLCLRARVAEEYQRLNDGAALLISGRRGGILLGGDDHEICYAACHIGLGMGIFPELRLTHLIPKERVAPEYLLKIIEGAETSNLLLGYKWNGTRPKSPFRPWGLLWIVKNLIIQRGFDRRIFLAKVRAIISARNIIGSTPDRGGVVGSRM